MDMEVVEVEVAMEIKEVMEVEVVNVEDVVAHLVTNLEVVVEEAQDKLLHPGVAPEEAEVDMVIKVDMAPKEDMVVVVLKEATEAAAVEAHGEVLKVKEDRILGAKTKAEEVVMVEEVIPGEKIQDGSTTPWAIKAAKAAGVVTPAADKAKGVGVMTAVMAKVVAAAATKEAIIMAVVLHLVVAVEAVPCEEGPEAAVAMEAAANDLLLIR